MLTLILGLFRKKSPPKSLLEVAFQGDLDAVREKLLAGTHIEERGPQGATALMLACQEAALARELLPRKPNVRNALGVTWPAASAVTRKRFGPSFRRAARSSPRIASRRLP
jgi:hypothetical protein